jgi:ribosomal protein L19
MRVQTRSKENLIRVDIPDPGDNLLMHQEGFESATSRLQHFHKILLRRDERIQAKSASAISIKSRPIQQGESPKPTGIPVP